MDRSGLASLSARRKLQIVLGFIWLVDAALQYQPYMFTRAFVTGTIEPAAAGNAYFVEHPSLWSAHFMIHHIAFYNTIFATLQLFIALAMFSRRSVKLGLAVSIVWSIGVWWLAEGIGGITDGASPVMGAPGAVIIYALIAVLVWPRRDSPTPGASVAETSPLGSRTARALWALLWVSFVALALEASNRAPSALHDTVLGMASGEPGWIKTLDRALAAPLAHHGTEASVVEAVLFALVAVGIFVRPIVRPALVVAMGLGTVIWLAEDFGGVFTGSATDVNSGPLLVLLAAAFWPVRHWGGRSAARLSTPPPEPQLR